MKSSFWLPKFDQFKSFDSTLLSYPPKQQIKYIFQHIKQQGQRPTQDGQQLAQIQKYATRSIKILADPLNISFQEDFMNEHKWCFNKELQKYVEHQQNIVCGLKEEYFGQGLCLSQQKMDEAVFIYSKIRENTLFPSQIQRQRFIIDLRRQDKLNEFLQVIFRKVNTEGMQQIFYIANELWEEYILIQDLNYTFEETIEFAQNWAKQNIKRLDEKLWEINYKQQGEKGNNNNNTNNKQRITLFQKFTTFLSTTFSLVIAGYFQNPYKKIEQNYFKRDLCNFDLPFSADDRYDDYENEQSEEESQVILNNKKVKY